MERGNYVLAIDQGTTGTTLCLISEEGRRVAAVNQVIQQHFPQAGWVEHDLDDIWNSVILGIQKLFQKSQVSAQQVAALGITNQRESVGIWDRKTGEPLTRSIVWQCRRTTEFCHQLRQSGVEKTIREKTGLVIDPYFSSTKVKWLFDHLPRARDRAQRGEVVVGTMDSFLIHRLTGCKAFYTDVTNASRTQLMNIETSQWDQELLDLFQVPDAVLPEIRSSSGLMGVTKNVPGLPDGLPISGVAGDQQSALFGQLAVEKGASKCTFGTGSFLLMNTGAEKIQSRHGLLTTIAWQLKDQPVQYALEGGAFICGAAVQWLRDGLGIIKNSSDIEGLAKQVSHPEGVTFVPALSGLGAPHWRPEARGLLTGLTRGTLAAHIARATLEAMALQNVEIFEAMEKDTGQGLLEVKVDGGAVVNDLLMQMQSDFLGVRVVRPQMIETTALGAAYLAGLGVGLWSDLSALKKIWSEDRVFEPQLSDQERALKMKKWQEAVERA